jgi:hypothetical protein
MKKFLMVLAIGAFAACNNSATSTEKSVDSSANVTVDSMKTMHDSATHAIDTATSAKVDSVKAAADSLKKK